MKTPFTQFQTEELIGLVEIRIDTIVEDPESADHFETEESLEALKSKFLNKSTDYSKDEIQWIVTELENRIEVGYDNGAGPDERASRAAFIKSLNNAMEKVQSNPPTTLTVTPN